MRLALGISYNGHQYQGWQSQRSGLTVQDKLEQALKNFAGRSLSTLCAGRTDAGVHALTQVVHFDTPIERQQVSWVRGVNRFLPADIAVQWAQEVPYSFHCRASALSRRYVYVVSQSPVRPSLDTGRVGWTMYALDQAAMERAAAMLVGSHDFSSFRASACQARTPVKHLTRLHIHREGIGNRCHWHFEFEADAFLHHMVRNIVGSLVAVGRGDKPAEWMAELLEARSRKLAAPTFSPAGLYFVGPTYDAAWGLPPEVTAGLPASYDGPP